MIFHHPYPVKIGLLETEEVVHIKVKKVYTVRTHPIARRDTKIRDVVKIMQSEVNSMFQYLTSTVLFDMKNTFDSLCDGTDFQNAVTFMPWLPDPLIHFPGGCWVKSI